MSVGQHVYKRHLGTESSSSLRRLSQWIASSPGDVLDVGMGAGSLGAYLNDTLRMGIAIDGITLNPSEADQARPFYRQAWVGDLERAELNRWLAQRRYRWIVCADVLEHLREPERLLQQCKTALLPHGELLVSIPNASYAGLIADLLHGRWRYGPEGLLDRTHVRFFTRLSFSELLRSTGWHIREVDEIRQPWYETEFVRPFDDLPPCVARYILAQPHTHAYQWLFRASLVSERPTLCSDADTQANTNIEGEPPIGMASYRMSLYLGDDKGYRPDRCIHTLGTMGVTAQTIEFCIPAEQPLRTLRLDPADRPGYWHLRRMCLSNRAGDIIWHWQATDAGRRLLMDAQKHQVVIGEVDSTVDGGPFLMLVLTGEDPQFELPIAPETVLACAQTGGKLTVECDWPWSADYRAAVELLNGRRITEPPPPQKPEATCPRPTSMPRWALALRRLTDAWRQLC